MRSFRRSCEFTVLTIAAVAWLARAEAAVLDEAVAGDLSDSPEAPSPWTLSGGANTLRGTAGGNFFAGESDFDLVSITVPPAHQLDSIVLSHYENIDEFSMSFLAVEPGPVWSDALGWDIQGYALMGWAHLAPQLVDQDVLQELRDHASGDFPTALPSGMYTFLIEDVDFPIIYELVFNLSSVVPEPATPTMLLAAAACWRAFRRVIQPSSALRSARNHPPRRRN